MDGYNELNSVSSIEQQKYHTLVQMDCCCFFEYDISEDRLRFSDNRVVPELSGKVIEHCTFQASQIISDEDVQTFIDFLHFGKEYPIEFQIKSGRKNMVWCQAKGRTVYEQQKNPVAFIGYIQNIDDKKRKEAEENEKLLRDELTGVLNPAGMKEKISFIFRESDLEDTYVLLIAEICHQEELVKYFGEVFSDVVLTNIVSRWSDILSEDEFIGRIGTDKFMVFLRGEQEEKIKRIIRAVKETYTGEKEEFELYCRVGSAQFPKDGTMYDTLFHYADIALFQAKQEGRENWIPYTRRRSLSMKKQTGTSFYNAYHTDIKETSQTLDVDMKLVHFTLDLLEKTKDFGSAINVLLDKIGQAFGATDVIVMERENEKVLADYRWNCEEGIGFNRFDDDFPSKLLKVLDKGEASGEIQCISERSEIENKMVENSELDKYTVDSLIICGYYDKDSLKGCLFLDVCGSKKWKKSEIDSFVFITKILAFYLLKLRESERITEQMQMIENYDMLTGLPTLQKFRIDIKIIFDTHPEQKFAIGFLDINNFKYINDTLGYDRGDELLKDLALFLNREAVPMQINARASADNFVSFIPFSNEKVLKERITELINQFIAEEKEKNISYNIGIAIGLYVLKPDEKDFMGIIDNANIARKLVKNSSMSMCEFYDEKMEREIMKEQMILGCMETALKEREFKVFLQPKISLKTGEIIGAEALVRWIRKDGTLLPPNDFIPLFEKNGFIVRLDFYIYEEVFRILKRWKIEGKPLVPISVNVSRVHLYQTDFIDKVMQLIEQYEIEPKLVEFELTESIFLDNTVNAISIMKELQNRGFCVSIDDFGAGYSSLNLLKDMRTDVLKLDKEFFRAGDMKKEEKIIVSSIISMAKQLNMKVLSEGVETQKQSDFLKKVNCDMAQGYLYAKPLPVPDFEVMLLSYEQAEAE